MGVKIISTHILWRRVISSHLLKASLCRDLFGGINLVFYGPKTFLWLRELMGLGLLTR